jgi:hypothetical protein
MKPLSQLLTQTILRDLRQACKKDLFPGVDFENAMEFLLTDGILPRSDLPAESFLRLEDWVRSQGEERSLSFTATELKNQTGKILGAVIRGNEVTIRWHGRPIATIRPVGST